MCPMFLNHIPFYLLKTLLVEQPLKQVNTGVKVDPFTSVLHLELEKLRSFHAARGVSHRRVMLNFKSCIFSCLLLQPPKLYLPGVYAKLLSCIHVINRLLNFLGIFGSRSYCSQPKAHQLEAETSLHYWLLQKSVICNLSVAPHFLYYHSLPTCPSSIGRKAGWLKARGQAAHQEQESLFWQLERGWRLWSSIQISFCVCHLNHCSVCMRCACIRSANREAPNWSEVYNQAKGPWSLWRQRISARSILRRSRTRYPVQTEVRLLIRALPDSNFTQHGSWTGGKADGRGVRVFKRCFEQRC